MLRSAQNIQNGKMVTIIKGDVRSKYGKVSIYAHHVYGESVRVRMSVKGGPRTWSRSQTIRSGPIDKLIIRIEIAARKFAKETNE